MFDTDAAKFLTAGKNQFIVLRREMSSITLNTTRANEIKICFENGTTLSFINTVRIDISIGAINFHVVKIFTLFLLCVNDMNELPIYLNNVTNKFVVFDKSISVIRK